MLGLNLKTMKRLLITLICMLACIVGIAQNKCFKINSKKHSLGMEWNSYTGMAFILDIDVYNHNKGEYRAYGFIQRKNSKGEWEYMDGDSSNEYVNNKGSVFAKSLWAKCNYDASHRDELKVYIPYNQMEHTKGSNDYRIKFHLQDKGNSSFTYKDGATNSYYYFTLEWQQEYFYLKPKYVGDTGSSSSSSSSSTSSNSSVKHTRTNTATGTIDTYYYPETNKMMTVTRSKCPLCYGRGVCSLCQGAGQKFIAAGAYSRWVPCTYCGMTGKCKSCNGTGILETVITSDMATGAYTGVTNGGFVSSGVTGDYSSGSTSSSSSSSSSRSSNDYIEVIEYAPDYTGNSPDVWCEKCQKWGPRHSHVKKRY